MRTPTRLILTLTSTFALAACGGEGGGGGPVESGVPPEKTGAELTADEAEQLCNASNDHAARQFTAAEFKEFTCVVQGLIFAAQAGNTPEECESFAQMCRDGAGEDEGGEEGAPVMCSLGFELSTCTATVADIEACMTEKNEAFGDAVRGASCDAAGKPAEEAVTGPSCTKVKSTCPGIA